LISYVYFKSSQTIYCKIYNVKSISTKDNTTIVGEDSNGDSSEVNFGSGSDYIILQNPIDKNIGDVIDISNLTDCRDFFILGKDAWYLEQLKKQFTTITEQQNKISDLSSDNVSTMLAVTELYEMTLS